MEPKHQKSFELNEVPEGDDDASTNRKRKKEKENKKKTFSESASIVISF